MTQDAKPDSENTIDLPQPVRVLSRRKSILFGLLGLAGVLASCCICSGVLMPGKPTQGLSSMAKPTATSARSIGVGKEKIESYFRDLGFSFQTDPTLLQGCASTRAWSPARNLEVHLVESAQGLVYANVALHNDPSRWTAYEQKMGLAMISFFMNMADVESVSPQRELERLSGIVDGFSPSGQTQSERVTPRARIRIYVEANPTVLNVTVQSHYW